MQKLCRIALAVSVSVTFSLSTLSSYALGDVSDTSIPELTPQSQHATASKRITARFTRGHYKKVKISEALSDEVFERFIKQLDYSRNVFLASDIANFSQYSDEFDDAFARGKLSVAYDIYNLNMLRRLERYQYALTLLGSDEATKSPFDFTKDEVYHYDRENAPWANSEAELNELWRLKVKSDALNLTLAGKDWPKVKEVLTKRYNYAIKRLKQSESEDVFQLVMNSFARVVEPHTSYLSPRNAERFQMDMNLSLEGIGAVLRAEEDYTVIQSIVNGGPADKSKQLKAKDRIVGVAQADKDFEDVIGWRLDDVVEKIKGPKGTTVRLQVLSGESDDAANIKIVTIVRDKIKLEDRAAKSEVYYEGNGVADSADEQAKNKTKKLGVITIPSFYNNLSRDVKLELDKLKEQEVEGIVIDLRGNGGGS
ncbi:MAG: PDZ domain-containing protein, partial [Colwellia sp.]|nr:PDZ domain-containing protein [Colwellia sp.]